MLQLGTVFSGIGAIEHALERLGIPYNIAFACDNGGINIFEKKVEKDLLSVQKAVAELGEFLSSTSIDDFQDSNALELKKHIDDIYINCNQLDTIYSSISNDIVSKPILKNCIDQFLNRFEELKEKNKIPAKISKKYELIKEYKVDTLLFAEILKYLRDTLSKEDFNKLNENEIVLTIEMTFSNQSKLLKELFTETTDSISMLYERIQTTQVHEQLNKLASPKDKKSYVDELYAKKKGSNFVYQTYKENYKIDDEDFHWNISFLDGAAYRNKIDLFVGGSPCQSFSMVGKRRGLEDTRGTLFYEYARLIQEIQPKVFIYENVRGLLNHDDGNTWEIMQQVFDDLGYNWDMEILNSKNYGVPQNRDRIFVVGFRKDLILAEEFTFPKQIELTTKMQDYLLDNVSGKYYLNHKGVDFVTMEKNIAKRYTQIDGDIQLCQKANQQFNWHGDFVFVEENQNMDQTMEDLEKYFLSAKVEKYVMSSGTKTFYSKPEIDLEIARPLLTTMHKMHRAGIDNYVTTAGRIRKLTPRECLRLMGFCDTFKIVVSDTQMYQQAGNSIVVDVLMHILRQIIISVPQITKGTEYQLREIDIQQMQLT